MTSNYTNLLVFCAVLGMSLVQAAPAASNTILVKTNNNCNIARNVRMTGVNGVLLQDTTPIAAQSSYTQYVNKDQSSLAWFYGGPTLNGKTDEVEMTLKDGVAWYDISYIVSFTGLATHMRPIMANGQSMNGKCVPIGCAAGASLATCNSVYWTNVNGQPTYSCGYNEIVGFEVDLC